MACNSAATSLGERMSRKYYRHIPTGTYWVKNCFDSFELLGIDEAECEEVSRDVYYKNVCRLEEEQRHADKERSI